MRIALQTLCGSCLALASAQGISPELLHRVTAIAIAIAIATGGLDTLPQKGAVVTLLAICQLSHCESYADIFMVAVLIPLVALAAVVGLGTVFGRF